MKNINSQLNNINKSNYNQKELLSIFKQLKNNIMKLETINSFDKFLSDHKAEETNILTPFIKYSKGGKLIIDLEDLNAMNVNNKEYKFLELFNSIKKELT